jgi:hypothetical protein
VQGAVTPGGEGTAWREASQPQPDFTDGPVGELRADTSGQPDRQADRKCPNQLVQSCKGALTFRARALLISGQGSELVGVIRFGRALRDCHRVVPRTVSRPLHSTASKPTPTVARWKEYVRRLLIITHACQIKAHTPDEEKCQHQHSPRSAMQRATQERG